MDTIDIRTTQNVVIEYELAGLRDRFIALLLDSVIVGILYLGFILIVESLGMVLYDRFLMMILRFFPLVVFILYHLCMEIFSNGQSFGKKAVGIKVVRIDGQEPSLSDLMVRAIFHLVDTFLSIGIVGAMIISSSSKNQRLGDMGGNTTVIKLRSSQQFRLKDILTINTLEEYEPQFPEIKNLAEKDMLLVKNTLMRYRNHPNLAHSKAINQLVTRLMGILEIKEIPKNKIEFLKTLIRDYIVLTR